MDAMLSGTALGIGVLGAVVSFLAPLLAGPPARPPARPRTGVALWVALGVVVVIFLLSLLKQPPWSPGQRMGWGYLIGGLAALVSALVCSYLSNPGRSHWPYPWGAALSLALASMSLTFRVFRSDPGDALLGCALGAVVVAGVFRLVYHPNGEAYSGRALEAAAALSATLAAACSLTVYHFDDPVSRGWWPFPLVLCGVWLLGQAITYVALSVPALARSAVLLPVVSGFVSAALTLFLGGILGVRLQPHESLDPLLLSGFATAALVLWLSLSVGGREDVWPLRLQVSGICVLLVVVLIALSFRLLAGFGVGVALLAAWAIAAPVLALRPLGSALPVQVLLIGANLLLLKVFLERLGLAVGEVAMSFHYCLMGVVLGVLLPVIYSSLRLRPGVPRALLVGVLGGLSPVALLALWGPDAILGLLVGLIACQGAGAGLTALAGAGTGEKPSARASQLALWQAPIPLVALLMGLAAAQFSRAWAFLYQMPRVSKAYVAAGIGLVIILWIIGLGVAQLVQTRRRPQAEEG